MHTSPPILLLRWLPAEIIKSVERIAKESLSDVHRAPFGWTKAFDIKVKGHPLAENAKVLTKQYSSSTTTTTKSEEGVSLASKGGRKITIILVYFATGRKTDSYK